MLVENLLMVYKKATRNKGQQKHEMEVQHDKYEDALIKNLSKVRQNTGLGLRIDTSCE